MSYVNVTFVLLLLLIAAIVVKIEGRSGHGLASWAVGQIAEVAADECGCGQRQVEIPAINSGLR